MQKNLEKGGQKVAKDWFLKENEADLPHFLMFPNVSTFMMSLERL